jgi:hypothetical protein
MPATAGTSASPANNANSDPQTALSFRSNWQAQMAVLAKDTEGELNGLSAEPETAGGAPEAASAAIADRAMQPAQGGSGPFLLASSLTMAGSRTSGSQDTVRAALVGIAAPLNARPAVDGYARSGTGAPASRLNPTRLNQAQLPVAVAKLAAPQQSARALTTDDPGTSKSTRNALPAKPPKQAEAAASSLWLGAPVAFAALPAPFAAAPAAFAAVPAAAIVPAQSKPLPSASSSLAAFDGKTLSDGSFDSSIPGAETASAPAGAIESFSNARATGLQQLHTEITASPFDKTSLTTSNSPVEVWRTLPTGSAAQAAAPFGTAAPEAGIAMKSTDGSATGAATPLIANRTGGPDLSVSLAAVAFSAGQTTGSGRNDTPVDLPLQAFTQVPHSPLDQGHAPSGIVQQQAVSAPVSGQEINRVAPPGNPAVASTVPAPVAAQISAIPVATNGSSASPQAARRTSRGTEAIAIGTMPNHSQPAVAAFAETTSNVRDSAGVPAAANPQATQNTVSSAPSVRETFAALDADPAPGAINWTHAGARQAEAGFEDPALGWVGVRADMSGGGVHATLLPGSVEAAQALGQHMDGLNAYMAQQHTPVESLAMGPPGSRDPNHGAERGLSQEMNQGAGQGTSQGQGRDAQAQSWAEPESSSTPRLSGVNGRASAGNPIQPIGQDAAVQVQSSRGAHISVVA